MTFGLSLILQNATLALFSTDLHSADDTLLRFAGVFARTPTILTCAASIVLCLFVFWLRRIRASGRGIAMRRCFAGWRLSDANLWVPGVTVVRHKARAPWPSTLADLRTASQQRTAAHRDAFAGHIG